MKLGRRGGLMVSALVSGSSGSGSIPGRGHYSWSLHATETGISSGLMSHLARMQTLPTSHETIK